MRMFVVDFDQNIQCRRTWYVASKPKPTNDMDRFPDSLGGKHYRSIVGLHCPRVLLRSDQNAHFRSWF